MQAYNIEIGPRCEGEPDRSLDGWCFGLPPGLGPSQWPLDPVTRWPLMHGFTLRLPEDYRIHGPQIVALSFFSTPPEGNDGGPRGQNRGAEAVVDAPGETPPEQPDLTPLWEAARSVHPRVHRMRDILGYGYAIVLLTEEEFGGPCCRPPETAPGIPLASERPAWMANGAAFFFDRFNGHREIASAADPLMVHAPLRVSARAADANAGRAPRDCFFDQPAENGYQNFFYWQDGVVEIPNFREHDWAKGHAANHIGGTMRPVQGVPEDFTPFYIGFEEQMGGYNFGDGNAQLDFKTMRFDWACG